MIDESDSKEFQEIQKMMNQKVFRGSQGLGKKKPRVVRTPYDFIKGSKAKQEYTGVNPKDIKIYYLECDEMENNKIENDINSNNDSNKQEVIALEDFLNIEDPKEAQLVLVKLVDNNYSDVEVAKIWDIPFNKFKTIRINLGVVKNRKSAVVEIKESLKWDLQDNKKLLRIFQEEQEKNRVELEDSSENIKVIEEYRATIKDKRVNTKNSDELNVNNLDEVRENLENSSESTLEIKVNEKNLVEFQGFNIQLNGEFEAVDLISRLESLCKNLESTIDSSYKITLQLTEVKVIEIKKE